LKFGPDRELVDAIREVLGLDPLTNGVDMSGRGAHKKPRHVKIPHEDIVTIRFSPESHATLALRYGVNRNTIYKIRKGKIRNVKTE
jgi:hypothetical protein